MPSTLNRMLAEGEVDAAPSSSIEYALHADRYRLLPDLVIGSRGAVRSIIFVCNREPTELSGRVVAIPTASATSVVLLKILLRVRWRVEARFCWFDQGREDPFATGADAALFIGDVALRPDLHPERPRRFDLGEEWWRETGLPFAFALWQAGSGADPELKRLHALLVESREYGQRERSELAARYGRHFGMPPETLDRYWADLVFTLDDAMQEGLRTFFQLAVEVGELPVVPSLRWIG